MNALVTGATGFVGTSLVNRLALDPRFNVRAAVRHRSDLFGGRPDETIVGEVNSRTDWIGALHGIDSVVHLAARVHMMRDATVDPIGEFRRMNVDATLHLAQQAAGAGIRRFVFLSSVKVNGERTVPGRPFRAEDKPAPEDPYGMSKCEAEEQLRELARGTGMELVIIRPVLVYGPGVKGNFLNMMRWLRRGVPLPFGAVHNLRSLVALDNLVDFIVTCLSLPAAANQTFLVSDGEDISTTELLRRAALSLGSHSPLLPVPARFLEVAAALAGKQDLARRLLGNLQVDLAKARTLLRWTPPVSMESGLRTTAQWLLAQEAERA